MNIVCNQLLDLREANDELAQRVAELEKKLAVDTIKSLRV